MAQTFKDLVAWQKGVQLAKAVYAATRLFPADERFGLVSQMRRAAVSVPSNIAEGYSRTGRADYVRFVEIARGSVNELET
jgi:four helix bundle protein